MDEMDARDVVGEFYGRGGILDAIVKAVHAMGKDLAGLVPADLAAVDAFHVRGREATLELALRAGLKPGERVIDIGSGLGGSVRYLASAHQVQAMGIDLTQEYVETARALAEMVGLERQVAFQQGDALALPCGPESFDVAWTEHAQMNVADKQAFYREISRVLVPGGRLVFHDIFQGRGGTPYFPVPWAEWPSMSFLSTPEIASEAITGAGFEILAWEDLSTRSLSWFEAAVEKMKLSGPPPLGLHLLMGSTAKAKFENIVRNLQEERIVIIQAVARKL